MRLQAHPQVRLCGLLSSHSYVHTSAVSTRHDRKCNLRTLLIVTLNVSSLYRACVKENHILANSKLRMQIQGPRAAKKCSSNQDQGSLFCSIAVIQLRYRQVPALDDMRWPDGPGDDEKIREIMAEAINEYRYRLLAPELDTPFVSPDEVVKLVVDQAIKNGEQSRPAIVKSASIFIACKSIVILFQQAFSFSGLL